MTGVTFSVCAGLLVGELESPVFLPGFLPGIAVKTDIITRTVKLFNAHRRVVLFTERAHLGGPAK